MICRELEIAQKFKHACDSLAVSIGLGVLCAANSICHVCLCPCSPLMKVVAKQLIEQLVMTIS